MDHLNLSNEKINMDQIYSLLADDGCGASTVFVGTTRDNFEGKKVISLEYEAYDSMALKEMSKICSELRTRWPILKHVVIHHRLGAVAVREASVVIAASSPHRAAALESVAFAIDQLKARVPIWKKEIYEQDEVGQWKENKECPWPKNLKSSANNFDFAACKVDQLVETIPQKLVQIGVDDNELKRRIKCFVKRKRLEINENNIMDFIQPPDQPMESTDSSLKEANGSCARAQTVVVKQEHSKGHLKVRRAANQHGPQLRPNYLVELNKLMSSAPKRESSRESTNQQLLDERLKTIESYMGENASNGASTNILHRVKNIESRILILESISPEYKHFFAHVEHKDLEEPFVKKAARRIYEAHELSEIIQNLKNS